MKSACCAPSLSRNAVESASPTLAVAATPSKPTAEADTSGMVLMPGGEFLMGGEGPETWPGDREGPVRPLKVAAFWIDETAVTNAQFARFVDATGFVTETERFGWSFVHHSILPKAHRKRLTDSRVAGLEWWYAVPGAYWRRPLGGGEDFDHLRLHDHPVVHVTWNDACAYAAWAGKRLLSEPEWEYAARGGLTQKLYPWGDDLVPDGKHRCNIWQGDFPKNNTGDDGYIGTAPAKSFKPNGYGLYNMTGNAWEWTADYFHIPPVEGRRAMRGGSYLCHASYCNRYRCSARTSNTPDSSAGHLSFRCAISAK